MLYIQLTKMNINIDLYIYLTNLNIYRYIDTVQILDKPEHIYIDFVRVYTVHILDKPEHIFHFAPTEEDPQSLLHNMNSNV